LFWGVSPSCCQAAIEVNFHEGYGMIVSNPSCHDYTDTTCASANPVGERLQTDIASDGSVSLKFAIGNSLADGPGVGRLKISADLTVSVEGDGKVCLKGSRSPFPSMDA